MAHFVGKLNDGTEFDASAGGPDLLAGKALIFNNNQLAIG